MEPEPFQPRPRRATWMTAILWIVAFVISAGLAIKGAEGWIQSIDDWMYQFVVDTEFGALVLLGRLLGFIGSIWVMAPLMTGVGVFLGVKHRWNAVLLWVVAIATSQLISITMKAAYGRPRPPMPLMETTGFSYPSGHAITAAVFAIGLFLVLVPLTKRRPVVMGVALAYILAMAWSRVYVRAHWLSDVTAGAAIGGAVVLTVALALHWYDGRDSMVDGHGEEA